MAQWLQMLWLNGWRCCGSLVGDVVVHWFICYCSMVADVVAQCLEMLWLIGWRCCGSLVRDVVAHWFDMLLFLVGDDAAQW